MTKLLLNVLLIVLIVLAWRVLSRVREERRPPARARRAPAPVEMARCPACGAFRPTGERCACGRS